MAADAAMNRAEGIMPKSKTHKLNDTHLVILSSASQRDDGLAIIPEGLRAAPLKAAVAKLAKLGFLKEVRVKGDQPLWTTDEHGKRIGLKITKAGAEAIGVEDHGEGQEEPPAEPKRRNVAEPQVASKVGEARSGSKRAQVIALMQRAAGATLDDMVEATGWLPHTTRAALTGLRHTGHAIAKSKNAEGRTVYRIDAAARKGTSAPRADEAHP